MLAIDPWFFFYLALLVLLVPLSWLLAAIAAAGFHELCHIGAMLLMEERIFGISIHPFGMRIEAAFSDRKRELLAALAGPVGSFSLLLLCHICPRLAFCGLVQGLFNLAPIYPLDGGRALWCILEMTVPNHAKFIGKAVEWIFLGALFLLLARGEAGLYWGLAAAVCLILRKIPCNESGNRVQ